MQSPYPSASGNLAVYTQRTYAFRSRSVFGQIRVREMNSPRFWGATDNPRANYPRWLKDSEQLIWLEAMDNGYTRFVIGDACLHSVHYAVGTVSDPSRTSK
ncbi:unnamed protein product [Penicillium nalgiovense]|uniref:Uncharacterized protein n=1 Tax=Penicillium nalgiovense TaxID=60175 RepID=A0A1V6YV94_PENNA|nr:hypothetical protein PENNAL_c0010G10172 [Penicillium nalgiovense]CAG8024784.1 unnamed protein product [Penicillium nalgiovense]CAG8144021.1 unnamed protein product [Penicillium nalgiovense]CAG8152017.1 unnamed protein product [Penicillium nalgiovense]CAG8154068.1 unnamed protein product [Penicillium nalgiovense]